MTSKRTQGGRATPRRRLARGRVTAWAGAVPSALLLLLMLSGPAHAVEVAAFEAVVPVTGTAEADRTAAFGEALKVAAVRASGRSEAATAAAIVAAAADPARYVQQYSTTAERMLRVGFDERAMEQLLQRAGLPRWPAERPSVTVLLFTPAVAGGARALTAADRGVERVEVERAAQLRGLALAWPSESLDPATARARLAAEPAALFGLGSGGRYEWVFAHAGQTVRAEGGVGHAIGVAADALAARYAPASTRGVVPLRLRIGGLGDVREYAALSEYLEGLSLVRSLGVREFERDTVQFELTVRGDAELLRRIFALDGRLVPAAAAAEGAPGAGVDYVWQAT